MPPLELLLKCLQQLQDVQQQVRSVVVSIAKMRKVDLRSVPKVKVNCNVCSVYTVNVINMKS